ncbi:phosphoethanolamine transferase [Aliivibrio fischeri]|uniref:phosphoethanolamine transferase n=1 Tax=Aliivibrio fischeri TaxID=668 RepID=UPI00080E5C99|nr:phosphoethanolamine transferase [Aliivibrio fischeri]OCH39923.1 hypothetical protein A6D99_07200 [Aliivibrio fischeri]
MNRISVNRLNVFGFFVLILTSVLTVLSFGYELKADSIILVAISFVLLNQTVVGRITYRSMVFIAACYIPISWNYGHPNLTIMSALLETNPSESFEYFKDLNIVSVLVGILFLTFALFAERVFPKFKNSRLAFIFFIVFILLACSKPVRTIIKKDSTTDYAATFFSNFRYSPISFIYDWYDSYNKYYIYSNEIMEQRNNKPTWTLLNTPSEKKNYILVVGESVRKDYMNAYGFPLENTPFMSSANGMQWDHFLSPGPNTFTSVIRFLTLNDGKNVQLNNNIITLANMAGIETYWLSNQGKMGVFDTGISALAHYSDKTIFTKTGSFNDSNVYDSALLPHVKEALSSDANSKLIIVHLIGSHPLFCDRVEGNVEFDFSGDKISCYVQSIKQTDNLLSSINDMAIDAGLPYSLIYLSDHGLGHRDNGRNLRHAPSTKESYEVPLFITGSDYTEKTVIENHRSGFHFIYALSSIMGIEAKELNTGYDFFGSQNDPQKVNNGEGLMVDLQSLADDPIK